MKKHKLSNLSFSKFLQEFEINLILLNCKKNYTDAHLTIKVENACQVLV